jgi:CBS domain-containing protein
VTALAAGSREVAVAYPDETLQEAIATLLKRNIGRLPVVDRTNPGKVVGYLGRADILAARIRLHDEEELREQGPLLGALRPRTRQ